MFGGISRIKAKIDEFQWDKLWGAKEKPLRQWVWGGNFLLSCCGFLLSFFFSFPIASLFIKSRCYMNTQLNIACKFLQGTPSSSVYRWDSSLTKYSCSPPPISPIPSSPFSHSFLGENNALMTNSRKPHLRRPPDIDPTSFHSLLFFSHTFFFWENMYEIL